jgi:hypothetical protein
MKAFYEWGLLNSFMPFNKFVKFVKLPKHKSLVSRNTRSTCPFRLNIVLVTFYNKWIRHFIIKISLVNVFWKGYACQQMLSKFIKMSQPHTKKHPWLDHLWVILHSENGVTKVHTHACFGACFSLCVPQLLLEESLTSQPLTWVGKHSIHYSRHSSSITPNRAGPSMEEDKGSNNKSCSCCKVVTEKDSVALYLWQQYYSWMGCNVNAAPSIL